MYKRKQEKGEHDDLMKLLKKHFSEDEEEIEGEEDMEGDETNLMKEMMSVHGEQTDLDESGDIDYGDEESHYEKDQEADEEEEEEDDEDKKLSKDKRKQLAIMVVAKKAGKKRKAM
jgi:hypothetical protein